MAQFPESEYCTFMYPDGRKCRSLKMPTRQVCIGHYRYDGQFEQDDAARIELAAVSRTLDSRRGVRKALAAVFRLIATDRIPPRKASLLLYNGQLILMSFPTRSVEEDECLPQRAKEEAETREAETISVSANDEAAVIGPLVPVKAGSNGSNGSGESHD
jgi:hypothetical protein